MNMILCSGKNGGIDNRDAVGKASLLRGSAVVYFKNPKTFFKKKSHMEYLPCFSQSNAKHESL